MYQLDWCEECGCGTGHSADCSRGKLTFESWMNRVNTILWGRVGMDADGCEDYNWYDEWEAGSTPAQAVTEALNYWGF